MTTNLAKWAPNNGQIIKSGLSDGRRAKFLPSVAGYDYYWLRTGGYLGNVGLENSSSTFLSSLFACASNSSNEKLAGSLSRSDSSSCFRRRRSRSLSKAALTLAMSVDNSMFRIFKYSQIAPIRPAVTAKSGRITLLRAMATASPTTTIEMVANNITISFCL